MIECHLMDMRLKDLMMMVLVMYTDEDDTMLHMEKTGMWMLVVEIGVGGMTADVVDKLTCSSDVVQPRQSISLARSLHPLQQLARGEDRSQQILESSSHVGGLAYTVPFDSSMSHTYLSQASMGDDTDTFHVSNTTNNHLRTSSNTSRANQDNSPRINKGTGYDNQRIVNVAGAKEIVGTKVVQKSRIQCYNCKEFRCVAMECQKPKRAKDAAYHKEKMLLCKQEEAGFQLNAEQADWKDDTDDETEDQELEAHYMYMAQIQEVTPDAADNSGPIFDSEPLQKVSNNDNYNVFTIESEHPEQSKYVNDTYPIAQDEHNMIIDSLDMRYDREQVNQDDDYDLSNERDLLASLIEKLRCEINE
nr:hypothetical protein [Tanacetum cinerariifolium]